MDLCQEPEIRRLFRQLSPNSPFLDGQIAAQVLQQSLLAVDLLEKIWDLSDVDKDGRLTENEFVVAFHLCVCVLKRGLILPSKLPAVMRQVFQRPNKFVKGDVVEHFRESDGVIRHCTVVGVHLDDLVNGVYYTLKLTSNGNELQSQESKLDYVGNWQKQQAVVAAVKEESDEDEFGDFTQASGAVRVVAPRDDFLDLSFGAPSSTHMQPTSMTLNDTFGDFTSSSSSSPPKQQQQQFNDVSFGDFTSSYFPPQQQQQSAQVGSFGAFSPLKQQQDISFGDFSSFLPPVPPPLPAAASPVRRFSSAPLSSTLNEPSNNNQFMLRRADSSGGSQSSAAMSSFLPPIMPQPASNIAPVAAIVTTHFGQQAFDQDHQASFLASDAASLSSSSHIRDTSMLTTPLEEEATDATSNEFDSSMQFTPATTVYDRRNVVQDALNEATKYTNEEEVPKSSIQISVEPAEEENIFDFSTPAVIKTPVEKDFDFPEQVVGKEAPEAVVEEEETATNVVEAEEELGFAEPIAAAAKPIKQDDELDFTAPVTAQVADDEGDDELDFSEAIVSNILKEENTTVPAVNVVDDEFRFPEAVVSKATDEEEIDSAEPVASKATENNEFDFPEAETAEAMDEEETDPSSTANVVEEIDLSFTTKVADDEFGFPETIKDEGLDSFPATKPMEEEEVNTFPAANVMEEEGKRNSAEPIATNAVEDEELDSAVAVKEDVKVDSLEFNFPETIAVAAATVDVAQEDDSAEEKASQTNVGKSSAAEATTLDDPFDFFQVASSPMPTLSGNAQVDVEKEEPSADSPNLQVLAAAKETVQPIAAAPTVQASSIDDDPFDFFQVASSPIPNLNEQPAAAPSEFMVVSNSNASSNSSFEVVASPPPSAAADDDDFDFFQTAPTAQPSAPNQVEDDDDFGDFQ